MATCPILLGLEARAHWEEVGRLELCFDCLRGGHLAGECNNGIRCTILGRGGRHYQQLRAAARWLQERTNITCEGHFTATSFQKDFVPLGILTTKLRFADLEILGHAQLDKGSGTTLIMSDALSRWAFYNENVRWEHKE